MMISRAMELSMPDKRVGLWARDGEAADRAVIRCSQELEDKSGCVRQIRAQ